MPTCIILRAPRMLQMSHRGHLPPELLLRIVSHCGSFRVSSSISQTEEMICQSCFRGFWCRQHISVWKTDCFLNSSRIVNQANRLPVFLCGRLPECSVNEDSSSIPATCLGQRRRKVEWGQCTNGLSDGALCSLPSVLAILRVFSGSCGSLVGGRGYPPDTCS